MKIAVIGLEEDECKLFIKAACGMPVPAGSGFKEIGEDELQFYCRPASDMQAAIEGADRAALLVHHMDLITVQRLRAVNDFMVKEAKLPYTWTIFKPEGESEFKISCIECGQKIMVPDARQGADARCPKCKKAFNLPTREEHLLLVLGIEDESLVTRLETDDQASIDQALATITKQAEAQAKPAEDSSGKKKIRIRKNTGS